jgi:predicted NAD-dependent protein-ADP-ribosyltransferase YbiA (DUF1768 family)
VTIAFTKVSLPHGWLGNMAPYPITWGGFSWRTSEAVFQALRFRSLEIHKEIREEKSPLMAKAAAKKNFLSMYIKPCSPVDVENMEFVLRLKLNQHKELEGKLLATGSELIVEDVTSRNRPGNHRFWGAALVGGEWVGENVLGKLWMKLRGELEQEKHTVDCKSCKDTGVEEYRLQGEYGWETLERDCLNCNRSNKRGLRIQ